MSKAFTIQDLQETATRYGGKCLSKEYANVQSPVKWMCAKGHTWDSSYNRVSRGFWCRQCLKNETLLKELADIARKRKGLLLSKDYVTPLTLYKFQCHEGHTFSLSGRSVQKDCWCIPCRILQEKKKELDKLKSIAERKGGKCLSAIYKNKHSKIKLQCGNGHIWSVKASHISRGAWCVQCKREELCKEQLASLKAMAKTKGGKCLSPVFKRLDRKLEWQCKEGHKFSTTGKRILMGGWCRICSYKEQAKKIRKYTIPQLRKIASDRGGKLLTKEFISTSTPMEWECTKRHQWIADVNSVVRRNSWCRKCYTETKKLSIEDYKKIAESRNGVLLSKTYIQNKLPLKWKCEKGHIWTAEAKMVKQGSWCPKCAVENKKLPIELFQNMAKRHEGELLSKNYEGLRTALKWKCKNGHIWLKTPKSVQAGHWCPVCD